MRGILKKQCLCFVSVCALLFSVTGCSQANDTEDLRMNDLPTGTESVFCLCTA